MSHHNIQFGRPSKKKAPVTELEVMIDNLSLEGAGVAKHQGKAIFVGGAIPGEKVKIKITNRHKSYDQAQLIDILEPSVHRVVASCDHYEQCGGCQLQHIDASAQLEFKEKAVLSLLQKNAKTPAVQADTPLTSPALHYRRSARIGINQLQSTQSTIVGFRRKQSSKLLQVSQCPVLPKHLAGLFDQLRNTIDQIDNAKTITHIEYLQGDEQGALTFRCKSQLTSEAIELLINMLKPFNLRAFLRYDSGITALEDLAEPLYYQADDLKFYFEPGDFLQVNAQVNQEMIKRAIEWLAPTKEDKVLDLFCGLGNFSLPLAKRVDCLSGVEGSEKMVARASDNAAANQLHNCQFFQTDLTADIHQQPWYSQTFNKLIIDPPRSGATDIISKLLTANKHQSISHILYVACDPISLARDTKLLANLGYEMVKVCVMDMFPNTLHIESMALFTRCATKAKSPQKNPNKKKKSLFR